jgi:hypothetical protein
VKKKKSVKENEDKNFMLWYRGQANCSHSLIPGLYRKCLSDIEKDAKIKFWNKVQADDELYLRDFKIRNYHMVSRLPENDLIWMSMMQHYGTPTRLLDWSENALSAFFFALEDYFSNERKNENVLPCIWCLKPKVLTEYTIRHHQLNLPGSDGALLDMISLLNPTQTGSRPKLPNENLMKAFIHHGKARNAISQECYPLALIPPYNNDRIRAQLGAFCLFPINVNKPVQSIADVAMDKLPGADQFLKLFILLKPAQISYELKALGIKRSMFYPEMPSSSYDIEQELNLHLR